MWLNRPLVPLFDGLCIHDPSLPSHVDDVIHDVGVELGVALHGEDLDVLRNADALSGGIVQAHEALHGREFGPAERKARWWDSWDVVAVHFLDAL